MIDKGLALITGVNGQDGAHLAHRLLLDGWRVMGGYRRGSSSTTWRLDHLGITNKIELFECQITEPQNLIQVIQESQPEAIFHLAGESFVADSFRYPGVTLDVNTHGVVNVLEAVRLCSPDSKVFCASSSEIFGSGVVSGSVNEEASFFPTNPYAISKLAALNFVRLYRDRYGMFSCSGILFNHEGPLRGRSFVTRKITFNLARLKINGGEALEIGNLDSARDWGSANDYVEAMRSIIALDEPDDFVVATGKLTTVRDFLSGAAMAAGFDPVFEGSGINEVCYDRRSSLMLAKVSQKYFRLQDTPPMLGDSSRIHKHTGWKANTCLENLIEEMVEADLKRWELGITHV